MSNGPVSKSRQALVDCSDLYDKAAGELKKFDSSIDRTIQELARRVEERGVPKNKVARQVVKELTSRGVLSQSRIYQGLGIEHKRKYKKKRTEENFPLEEKISRVESSLPPIEVSTTGQEEIYGRESGWKTVKRLQSELNDPKEELKNALEDTKMPRNQLDVDHIPGGVIVEDKVGLVKKASLATLSEPNKRGYSTLVGRYGEVVRRKLAQNNGRAAVRLYLNVKDVTTNIEYLIPVNVKIDIGRNSVELELDESRI